MDSSVGEPLIFLDVDGPLIPFGAPAGAYPNHGPGCGSASSEANPLLARINSGHGSRLAALPGELVWATTWMADANDYVAPRLGLPELAVVTWPEPSEFDAWDERHGLHWKTRALVTWAAGRPFAWVDDEITSPDRTWVMAHHRGPALLHRVDPRHGLTDADFSTLHRWLTWVAAALAQAPDLHHESGR
ncbi:MULTISPECIES: HAD domain-containing protein [unclassified Pseudofrankia]|uniref:HAD domain-containing protein n=1 Tax=unclassified Pseudofrankia TaxID=2994372 RepID=UPI0008D9928A|nr:MULTISPECIES: HAD domain-containing protein [unclassified Pseudofrankia]MDT3440646.1 hypothetical protein [Pseudofrankia sp. BMG5.37]OHV60575.1 hypothetical protein BCD48_05420 [Pseudofrankia sp. BMG5.36]